MAEQQHGSSAAYYQGGSSNDYYSQHPQQNDGPGGVGQLSPYSEGPTPAEGERGLLGALGGGAAGGYVGHQTCHGFLGTVGGALVGSLAEDWAKKKRPSRPSSPQPPPAHPAHSPPATHCPPAHSPPPQYGYGGPYAGTHTTVTTDSYAAVSGYSHSPPGTYHTPNYTPHPPHPAHPPSHHYPQPSPPAHKPCGHTGHCTCKITSFWKT